MFPAYLFISFDTDRVIGTETCGVGSVFGFSTELYWYLTGFPTTPLQDHCEKDFQQTTVVIGSILSIPSPGYVYPKFQFIA